MFSQSKNLSIHGGEFMVIQGGKDLWHNQIAPGAFHNSLERLKYDPPKCHPDTRVAVIEAIIDWIKDGQKTSFIKWLNGPAGAGKSAIAQEIAELCYKSGYLAASFFWSRGAFGRNNEDRLIASLAYQLFTSIPQLRRPIGEVVENDRYIFTRDLATQMESLIIQPWKKLFENNQTVGSNTPKVIILDGLDECGTEKAQQSILKVIADSLQKFPIPLCFLIASRPEKAIRHSFNDQLLFQITSPLVLDEKYHPDDDIRLFLVESFESVKRTHELRSLLPRDWPTHKDIDLLVRKSSGQFIYPATVVKFVRSPSNRPKEQLDIILGITAAGAATPFAELDALYSHIFSLVLKDHLPRALEIIGFAMLVNTSRFYTNIGAEYLTARQIETILSYSHGDVQLNLIDLHSVLHVPTIKTEDDKDDDDDENDDDGLHFFHASLEDFLFNPSRSKDFYIDQGKAKARIAQHFLRYIREYSPDTGSYSCTIMVFHGLCDLCSESSATRELLLDCFTFDPQKWASVIVTGSKLWEKAVLDYLNTVNLQIWFQAQEAKVLEYFGPERSLLVHPGSSWKAAIDIICGKLCRSLHEEYPNDWENAATALTHPEIFRSVSTHSHISFEKAIGVRFYFTELCDEASDMEEIKKYLCDQERAGRYFVDGGMYATLCLRLFKLLRLASDTFQRNPREEDGGEQGDDDGETPEGDDNMAGEYSILPPNDNTLELVIEILPFYFSRADYQPNLAIHARSLLSQKIGEGKGKLLSKIRVLHEAIGMYLNTRLVFSTAAQQQFQMLTLDNQPINSEPEAITDEVTTASELRVQDKRRRESKESPDVVDASIPASPTVPRPTKRLRIVDMLN